MQPAPEPVVLEARAAGYSDRDRWVLIFGGVLAVLAVGLALYYLPYGLVLIIVLVLGYPGIGLWRTMRRDWRARAPRLVLGPDALEAGELRIRWKDVTEVGSRSPAGAHAKGGPVVGLRLNRLAPVQPVPSTLRRLGLGSYDGYFDVTIPAAYARTPAEIVILIEALRQRAAAAPALDAGRAATPRPPARPRPRRRPKAPPPE